MTDRARPRIYTIPPHAAFADRLAEALVAGFPFGETGELALARTTLVLPNRRAARSMRDAFVRASGGALLLPSLQVLGDLDDELMPGIAAGAEDLADAEVVGDLQRTVWLTTLVERWQEKTGQSRAKVESWRLAEALGRALDLMQLYGADPAKVAASVEADMAGHWQRTVDFLDIVTSVWPDVLAERGVQDRVAVRQARLKRLRERWRAAPPDAPVIAAGFANADPVAAEVLADIARLPKGAVVLPGLDTEMDEERWSALAKADTHPQVPLKLLLDAMEVRRGEVEAWPETTALDGPPVRTALVRAALAPTEATAEWRKADIGDPGDFKRFEARTPAEEALGIALAMRRTLATEGKSAALVTPDRVLARRVAAQMRRWGVEVDDSAGQPLSLTPPGAFLRLALDAAQSGFAPTPLLALLKHPLAGPEEGRADWLAKARRLDLALRGVRPARGLQGVRNRLTTGLREKKVPAEDGEPLVDWWKEVEVVLRPVAALFQRRKTASLPESVEVLTGLVEEMSDARFWKEAAGRAAADLMTDLKRDGGEAAAIRADDLPALLTAIMAGVAVRPAYGTHPRLSIYGLLEARLQRADLMILGGLNEGVWPPTDTFDPWLPPKVRAALGLPPTDRAIALSAHDFASACGAPEVLLTRALRDETAPTVASRFWLRLEALLGARWEADAEIAGLAGVIDASEDIRPADRPAPKPPVDARPKRISVTQVETLRADPFQFYARDILRLKKLDALGEDAGASDRGTIVHDLLEKLTETGSLHDEAARLAAIEAALKAYSDHPLLTALWQPRVERMLSWAAAQMREMEAAGWTVAAVEGKGEMLVSGVELRGRADVIFEGPDGYAVADYKTGAPPSPTKIRDGYADQLALLAWMVEAGAFEGLGKGTVSEIAYWRLSGGQTEGQVTTSANPRMRKDNPWAELSAHFEEARARFRETAARWLTRDEAFTARLKPEYAPEDWNDYQQLARVQEWEGRARG